MEEDSDTSEHTDNLKGNATTTTIGRKVEEIAEP